MSSESWVHGVYIMFDHWSVSCAPQIDSRYRASHEFDRIPVPSPDVVQHVVQQVVQHVRVWSTCSCSGDWPIEYKTG